MATDGTQPELENSAAAEAGDTKERKIPVFTVIKSNSILKNIFLVDSPPTPSNSEAVSTCVELEEVLVVGRHPDCNITLEHPSISRFHLRIHSIPALQKLSVFDLSSVHGSWVSGKKVEPGVRVELHEGDTLQLGGSTRVYRLHWVPLSQAYDIKNPFVPALGDSEVVDESQDIQPHLKIDVLHSEDDESEAQDDYFEGLDLLFSDMNMMSPMQELTSYAPLLLKDTKPPFYYKAAESNSSLVDTLQLSDTAEKQPSRELGGLESDVLHIRDIETENQGDYFESLDLPSSDRNMKSPIRESTPYAPLVLEDTNQSFYFADVMNNSNIAEIQPVRELGVLERDVCCLKDNESENQGDYFEGLDFLFSDTNMKSPIRQSTPPLVLKDTEPSFYLGDAVNNSSSLETLQLIDIAEIQPVRELGGLVSDGLHLQNDSNMHSPIRQSTPYAPLVLKDVETPFYSADAENNSSSLETLQLSDIAEIQSLRELGGLVSDGLHLQDDETEVQGDYFEGLDSLFSNMNLMSPVSQLISYAPQVLGDIKPPSNFEVDAESKCSFQESLQLSEIAGTPFWQLGEEKVDRKCASVTSAIVMNNSSAPAFNNPNPLEEAQNKACPFLGDDCLSFQDVQAVTPGDCYDGLDRFADIYMMSPEKKNSPSVSLLPKDIVSPMSSEEEDAENKISFMETLQLSEIDPMKDPLQLGKLNSDIQVNVASAEVGTFAQADCAESPPITSCIRSGMSIWKRRGKSASVEVCTGRSRQNYKVAHVECKMKVESESGVCRLLSEILSEGADASEEVFTPEKENKAPDTHLLNRLSKQHVEGKMKHVLSVNSAFISRDEEGEEAFTPDKENMTPKTHLMWSRKKQGKSGKVNYPNIYRSSPLKNAGSDNCKEVCIPVPLKSPNHFRKILEETICDHTSSSSIDKFGADILKVREHRLPFQSISVSSNKTTMEAVHSEGTSRGCKTACNMQIRESIHSFNNSSKGEIKMWTMVVDTACLLNKESRKSLQLMQGLRGTSLIIPRIVIRELDCMNKHCYFFRRNTGVSSALQWIKDCMENTKWWIHVQSSAEDAEPIAPTPRTWPLPQTNEEKEKFPASSVPFSPYGSFLDIVTPTSEDHILEYALAFRKTLCKGQLVLLSDDVFLKIKAMAEGLLCETAQDFRESLVNPFSSRFLWTDSSPRGPTWSCRDEVVLREKYCNVPSRKHPRFGEAAKGLKLILLHNSQYMQMSTIS